MPPIEPEQKSREPLEVIQVACPICEEFFTPTGKQLAAMKKGQNIFCSSDCYAESGRKRSKQLSRQKLEKEVVLALDDIHPKMSEFIRDAALEIVGDIDGRNGYAASDVARAVLLVACDKCRVGYRLNANPKVLKMVREKSGVLPLIDVKDIIPAQVDLIGAIAGWDDEVKARVMEKSVEVADAITDIKGTMAVKAGAIIYAVSRIYGGHITQQQVADIIGASDESLRKSYKGLTAELGIELPS